VLSWTTAAHTAANDLSSVCRAKWPTFRLVHTPVHASWMNQIEIYFSIVQRKVLTPENDDFAWPHRDGLMWPHFSSVVVDLDVA
jgi:hypothetical protein